LKFDIDYYVREKVAPTGYTLSSELYKFQLKNTKDEKNITYNYKDEKIKGEIEFFKTGENNIPLEGAEFTLYMISDTSYSNPIAIAISDENGKVNFKNVEYGEYAIKETKAPEGYIPSGKILTAIITENGKIVKANPESISNTKIRGNIEFNKLGEDKNPLQGAEFKLYKEIDTKFENPIATAISDESGKVQFENVEYGEYTIKESKAPEGYLLSSEILTAIITEDGKVVKANPESISNTKIRGSIEFTKLDEDKNPLQGAEFKIYKEVDTKFENPIATAISNEQFENVEYGKYTIKETKAPEGYVILEEVLTANITENDKTVKANPESVSNTRIRASIQVKKLDQDKKPLKGAEFTLYNSEGKEIKTFVSGEDGTVLFKDILYGEYTIKETKVPEGYLASEGTIKVFVDKDGEIYSYEVVNNRIKGSIVITKTDMNGKVLQGAEFTLYDRVGKEVTTVVSDKDGIAAFNDVDYGSYTIKETKAPKGYILSKEELQVKVNSTEIQKFTVKNEAEKIVDKIINVLPKTGGVFDYKLIIGALAIIGGVSLVSKRKK